MVVELTFQNLICQYKATADVEAGIGMYQKYTAVPDDMLPLRQVCVCVCGVRVCVRVCVRVRATPLVSHSSYFLLLWGGNN